MRKIEIFGDYRAKAMEDLREECVAENRTGASADCLQEPSGSLIMRQTARYTSIVHVKGNGYKSVFRHRREQSDDVDALGMHKVVSNFVFVQDFVCSIADSSSLTNRSRDELRNDRNTNSIGLFLRQTNQSERDSLYNICLACMQSFQGHNLLLHAFEGVL